MIEFLYGRKTTRNKAPTKIPDDALIEDVKRYPDDYNYERARRLNCSKTGIFNALKRLGISQKKTLEHQSVLMSSELSMKKCYLRLSTLRQISIAIYFMIGVSSHLFQVSKLNV